MNGAETPRRAALYARVSTLRRSERASGETKSVGQQLDAMRAIATREKVTVVGEFRDDGVSASRYARGANRDGWRSTMDLITSGAVGELWVWEISRATRDRPVWAALVGACAAQGVLIVIDGKPHDPNDSEDGFVLDLLAALAVRESAITSKRVTRDIAARAKKGLPHGKIPYGYRRVYDASTGDLVAQVIDPDTADIVRELARRVLAGESLMRLSAEMNRRGVPSPEMVRKRRYGDTETVYAWRPDQVRDVVGSPAAAGLRVHRGNVAEAVKATWEPIIPVETHQAIRAKFDDPARCTWVDSAARYLLTGLARCGECGGEIRRIKNRNTPSYMCVGKRHGHDGGRRFCVARKIEWVDPYVADVMVERLSRPDLVDAFTVDDGDQVQAAQRDLVAHEAELAQLREAKKEGRISLGSFIEFEPDLIAKIAEARRRATPAAVPSVIADVAGAQAADRWAGLAMEQQREVIRLLAEVKLIKRPASAKGRRGFDPNLILFEWRHPLKSDAAH